VKPVETENIVDSAEVLHQCLICEENFQALLLILIRVSAAILSRYISHEKEFFEKLANHRAASYVSQLIHSIQLILNATC
jgi:hypothetical protein